MQSIYTHRYFNSRGHSYTHDKTNRVIDSLGYDIVRMGINSNSGKGSLIYFIEPNVIKDKNYKF